VHGLGILRGKKNGYSPAIGALFFGTYKSVFLTMLTNYGVKHDDYFHNTVQNELTMDVLFE